MFRSLTLFALCLFSLAVFAQTPATPPAEPETPPPAAATRKGKKAQGGKFLKKMDANADGKIARDEWKGKPEGFDKLDADKDGLLTQTEIRDVARDKGAELFKQFDANSDGKIARDEWSQRPRAFDRLDTNADGFLTPDELRDLKSRRHKKRG
jgi:Ca2+-binding EF-hand superfamily protein